MSASSHKKAILVGFGIALVVCVGVAVTLPAVPARYDLRLTGSKVGIAGRSVALHGVLFSFDAGPPQPASRPVDVTLRSTSGNVTVASTTLAPVSDLAANGALGSLSLADVQAGSYRLIAQADQARRLERGFEVVDTPPARAPAQPRSTLPVRSYQVFPTRPHSDGVMPPTPFELRFLSGACVPEAVCSAVILVGAPASSVRLSETAVVSSAGGTSGSVLMGEAPSGIGWLSPGEWSQETDGYVLVAFVPRGPDVTVELEARRGDEPVAVRRFRVPMVLGGTLLSYPDPSRLNLSGVPEGTGVFLDRFEDGIWEASEFVVAGPAPFAMPASIAEAAETPIRLQARTDPYSSSNAIAALVGDPSTEGRYLRALDELQVEALPASSSTRTERLKELRDGAMKIRVGAAVAVLALGFFACLFVVWRGVAGARVARRVTAQVEGAQPTSPALAFPMVLPVILLALAFLALGSWVFLRVGAIYW